jgi:hypothetical protein
MDNDHAIHALKDKRSEIIGQIRHLEAEIRKLRTGLSHVDGTLRIFSPETALQDEKGKPVRIKGYFRFKEIPVLCLTILRSEAKPITVRTLAKAIVAAKGLPVDDLAIEGMVRTRATQYLRLAHKRGLVGRSMDGLAAQWQLL